MLGELRKIREGMIDKPHASDITILDMLSCTKSIKERIKKINPENSQEFNDRKIVALISCQLPKE